MQINEASKDPAKISSMFSSIAPRYDLLNRLLSLGFDRCWRRFAVNQLPKSENAKFLDVATGTCDVALEIVKRYPDAKVVGVDFSEGMLELGRGKVKKAGLQDRIRDLVLPMLHRCRLKTIPLMLPSLHSASTEMFRITGRGLKNWEGS